MDLLIKRGKILQWVNIDLSCRERTEVGVGKKLLVGAWHSIVLL